MLICDTCKNSGNMEVMVRCVSCERIFHKTVKCVKTKELKLNPPKHCPACGEKVEKLNERICPFCGEHLWNLHIDCGMTF